MFFVYSDNFKLFIRSAFISNVSFFTCSKIVIYSVLTFKLDLTICSVDHIVCFMPWQENLCTFPANGLRCFVMFVNVCKDWFYYYVISPV